MAREQSTVERAAYELAVALEPLRGMLTSADAARAFVREALGFDAPEALNTLGIDLGALDAVIRALDDLGDAMATDDVDDVTIALRSGQLAAVVAAVAADIAAVGSRAAAGLDPAFTTASRFADDLPRRLLDWVVVTQIEDSSMVALESLRALGIVEVERVEADPETFTTQHVRRTVSLEPLVALVTDPRHWLELAYGWGMDQPSLERLLERLFFLAVARGFPAQLSWSDLQRAQALAGAAAFDPEQADAPPELRVPLFSAETAGAEAEAGLGLIVLPAGGAHRQGLALLPFADGALDAQVQLDQLGTWLLGVDGTLDLQAGFGIVARPGEGVRAVTDIDGAGAAAAGTFEVHLTRVATSDAIVLVSFPGGSGVFVTGVEVRAAVLLDASKPAELLLEAGMRAAMLRLSMDGADGFLRAVVPDLDLTFDAAIGISTRRGTYFLGGAALELTRSVNQRTGPVHIRELRLALSPSPAGDPPGIQLLAGLGVALSLGPVTAVVSGIGVRLRISEQTGGNVGPIDLGIGFKVPDGIALEVTAGPVTGGGFLRFDPEREQYAGAMQLQFEGIAVRATGLLTTRLPDGSDGFSLLVIVSAEFPPVQLGLGFMLVGVGGLLGINRTVAVEALRAGLKTGALGAVLSPPDPVANAGQLVAGLEGLFPPAMGRHVFGPTARIVWGAPTLITIDLCLVLELPAPVRLVVLGRLRAVLPDEREPIVQVQMDMLGVVDFDRCEAAVDATLVHSWLGGFALTGDMALRMSWGSQPSFLLAVGGFHPRFVAPAGFPALERVAVALATGENPKLRLEAYLALTSNTVQFGARVDLSARAGRFSVAGFLSFDALVTLAPLEFTVDIAAKLGVKAGGHTILSVSLELTLSGPVPWHARGRASFRILFLEISFDFDVTIGDDAPLGLPSPVDVASLVLAALADPRSWSAQLPAGGATLVTLRALDAGTEVLAHPLGTLEVRQRVAPLERTLERFGTGVPSGARRFRIAGATIVRAGATTSPARATVTGLQDLFAPGQFRVLSDEQKLSLPSFEAMSSGAVIGAREIAHGSPVSIGVVYEQEVVTAADVPEPRRERVPIPADVFAVLTATPAARQATFAVAGVP